jgi:hypothetical protein
MEPQPTRVTAASRRLLIVLAMIATLLALVPVAAWHLLPLLAPQWVIRHSPWIWPVIRAEAHETGGREDAEYTGASGQERAHLIGRMYDEEGWLRLTIPYLTAALAHRDLAMRRTATHALHVIWDSQADSIVIHPDTGGLAVRLLPLLGEADDETFAHAFAILQASSEARVAQALLPHLPRACGLDGDEQRRRHWFNAVRQHEGAEHPLEFLRHASVLATARGWLEADDGKLRQLACVCLGFSDDPRALDLLVAHLGRHQIDDPWMGREDPVAYGLSLSRDPRAMAALHHALGDPVADRRRSAVSAARWRLAPDSLPLLVAMGGDPDPAIRSELAQTIGAYPLEDALEHLAAIIARGGAPALAAIDATRRNLGHRYHVIRMHSADRAPVQPEHQALTMVVFTRFAALLPAAEPAVRVALVELVGEIRPPGETVRPFLRGLADGADPLVRAAAARALVRLERPE